MAVKPTRRTQPLRKGLERQRTLALQNAQRGKTLAGRNPMDTKRAVQKRTDNALGRGGSHPTGGHAAPTLPRAKPNPVAVNPALAGKGQRVGKKSKRSLAQAIAFRRRPGGLKRF